MDEEIKDQVTEAPVPIAVSGETVALPAISGQSTEMPRANDLVFASPPEPVADALVDSVLANAVEESKSEAVIPAEIISKTDVVTVPIENIESETPKNHTVAVADVQSVTGNTEIISKFDVVAVPIEHIESGTPKNDNVAALDVQVVTENTTQVASAKNNVAVSKYTPFNARIPVKAARISSPLKSTSKNEPFVVKKRNKGSQDNTGLGARENTIVSHIDNADNRKQTEEGRKKIEANEKADLEEAQTKRRLALVTFEAEQKGKKTAEELLKREQAKRADRLTSASLVVKETNKKSLERISQGPSKDNLNSKALAEVKKSSVESDVKRFSKMPSNDNLNSVALAGVNNSSVASETKAESTETLLGSSKDSKIAIIESIAVTTEIISDLAIVTGQIIEPLHQAPIVAKDQQVGSAKDIQKVVDAVRSSFGSEFSMKPKSIDLNKLDNLPTTQIAAQQPPEQATAIMESNFGNMLIASMDGLNTPEIRLVETPSLPRFVVITEKTVLPEEFGSLHLNSTPSGTDFPPITCVSLEETNPSSTATEKPLTIAGGVSEISSANKVSSNANGPVEASIKLEPTLYSELAIAEVTPLSTGIAVEPSPVAGEIKAAEKTEEKPIKEGVETEAKPMKEGVELEAKPTKDLTEVSKCRCTIL